MEKKPHMQQQGYRQGVAIDHIIVDDITSRFSNVLCNGIGGGVADPHFEGTESVVSVVNQS